MNSRVAVAGDSYRLVKPITFIAAPAADFGCAPIVRKFAPPGVNINGSLLTDTESHGLFHIKIGLRVINSNL